jgi:hypothetical protein
MSDATPRASIRLPGDFICGRVHANHKVPITPTPPAPPGLLAAFVGDWVGNGFNTIFRPNNSATPRIPQDLSSFITAGTITQALLDDPNSLLRSHISRQTITNTVTLVISTGGPP